MAKRRFASQVLHRLVGDRDRRGDHGSGDLGGGRGET